MRSRVPISLANFDTFSTIYFDLEDIPQYQMVESAYLFLEVDGEMTGRGFGCYLNEGYNYGLQHDSLINRSYGYQNYSENQIMIDISEIYYVLASRMKENNGIILEYGGNYFYSCQMIVVYRQEIIAPRCKGKTFFEKKISVSSSGNNAVSPFFLTANATTVTFCVSNFGDYPIVVSIENSPDARNILLDPQRIEILPNVMGVIIPTYFTKYVRIRVASIYNGIVTEVWYQSQQK
ncbi:DUF6385 domain-containing protein [Anaerotignum sp.]|uniref:DUF6385 domain-containing protein n=1 Tax=Anaerotignum sp. TaxID=2039241 RepID=UPI00289E883A|nr:DUF6385 domain-containing protein [Anaerotignum sp.]